MRDSSLCSEKSVVNQECSESDLKPSIVFNPVLWSPLGYISTLKCYKYIIIIVTIHPWFFWKINNLYSKWWGLKLNLITGSRAGKTVVLLCCRQFVPSHPAVSSLSCVWNQDGTLQLSRTQYGPPLAQSEDGVPALQRRFGKETCSS